jgi:hypothetical protein
MVEQLILGRKITRQKNRGRLFTRSTVCNRLRVLTGRKRCESAVAQILHRPGISSCGPPKAGFKPVLRGCPPGTILPVGRRTKKILPVVFGCFSLENVYAIDNIAP